MKALRTYLHVVLSCAVALALMAPAVAASPSCARMCAGGHGSACCKDEAQGHARRGGCCSAKKSCGTDSAGKRAGGCCSGNAEACPCCPQLVPAVLSNASFTFARVGVLVHAALTVPLSHATVDPPFQPPRA